MEPVVGQLVDEAGPVALPLRRGAREIILAEGVALVGRKRSQRAGVTIDGASDGRQVGQLARALDRPMAGKDLFDQRRSRAGHAEHEDRVVRSGAAAIGREQIGGHCGDGAVDRRRDFLAAIGLGLQPQPVRRLIMSEGGGMVFRIVHRLAQREVEVEAVVGGDRRVGQRTLHRGDVGGVEPDRLEVGQAPPQFAQRRLQPQRRAIGGDRFGLLADRLEHRAEAEPQLGLVRGAF